MRNILLENSVENWLINSNELGYQSAFCQLLIADGHAIHQARTHQGFEEGKDVITTDKNGDIHAFQLKGGNLSLSEWRSSIMVQIEELILFPVKHAAIASGTLHTPYLITNGFISDHVNKSIKEFNKTKWKDNPLQVWDIGILRQKFQEFAEGFLPTDISEKAQGLLWALYSSDGHGVVNSSNLTSFLEEIVPLNQKKNKSLLRRQVGILVLYSAYITQRYRECENWVSIIKILTITSSYILLLAEKFSLEEKYWKPSFRILQNEILDIGEVLSLEIQSDKYPDKLYQNLTDGELGKFRLHMAIETIFAIKIMQFLERDSRWGNIDFSKLQEKFKHLLSPLGEGQMFAFFLCFWLIRLKQSDEEFGPLSQGILLILNRNGRTADEGTAGIPNPYYNLTQLLKRKLIKPEEFEESFLGKSYLIGSFIALFVQYKQRKALSTLWREISYISQSKFVPKKTWQYFQWKSSEGELLQKIPNPTEQSWKELQDEIQKLKEFQLPQKMKENLSFMPLFLLFFPHRICPELVLLLDEELK